MARGGLTGNRLHRDRGRSPRAVWPLARGRSMIRVHRSRFLPLGAAMEQALRMPLVACHPDIVAATSLHVTAPIALQQASNCRQQRPAKHKMQSGGFHRQDVAVNRDGDAQWARIQEMPRTYKKNFENREARSGRPLNPSRQSGSAEPFYL